MNYLMNILQKQSIEYTTSLVDHVWIIRPGLDDTHEITTTGKPKRESRPKLMIIGLSDKNLSWTFLAKPREIMIPLNDLEELLTDGGELKINDCQFNYKNEKMTIDFFENHYELPKEKVDLIKKELEAYQLFERLKPYIVNMLKID